MVSSVGYVRKRDKRFREKNPHYLKEYCKKNPIKKEINKVQTAIKKHKMRISQLELLLSKLKELNKSE